MWSRTTTGGAFLVLPDGSMDLLFRQRPGQGFEALLIGAMTTMLGASQADPRLVRALGERWLEPRRRWGVARMLRAQAEGELRASVQPMTALSVLYGPL